MSVPPSISLRHDCPKIEPHAHLYLRTLHRACEKAGGIGPLARVLDVPARMLNQWLEGAMPVPQVIFLKAVDVLG